MTEKLQKVLARAGLGSRRGLEEIISAGRVSINGQIAQLGDRVSSDDDVRVDGRKIQIQAERDIRRRVIIYYKPEGEICSRHDPEGRPTVFEHLPTISRDRWVMVGRLDINSTGLLLFTNDGELANRLMHPSNGIEREYSVRVMGEVSTQIRQNLLRGVQLDDGLAKFESLTDAGGEGVNRWYKVVVKEGRNREVRRLFESQGLRVSRLLRIRYGVIHLPRELRTGRWLELDQLAINELAKSVNLSAREGVKFDEDAKRRIDKMLNNPMKARRVEQNYSRPQVPNSDGEKRYQSYSEYRQAHKQQRMNEIEEKLSQHDDERHQERPKRNFDDRKPSRFRDSRDDEHPKRNFDDRKPPRFRDNPRHDERPKRNFDDRKPPRFRDNPRHDERPKRNFDDRKPSRFRDNPRDDERPKRNFDDRKPSRFRDNPRDDERPKRQDRLSFERSRRK